MIQTSQYNASIVDRRDVHDGLFFVWVCPDGGEVMPFVPGQFVSVGRLEAGTSPRSRPRLVTRSYSIGSPAQRRDAVELFIVRVDDGEFTSWLQGQPVGARVWLSPRAAGRLTLDDVPRNKDLVLVSTGTGVAPYLSMYRTYKDAPPWRRIVIVNGVRRTRDLGYRDELEAAAAEDPRLVYIPLVTRDDTARWDGLVGRVQTALEPERYRALVGTELSPRESHVFLVGNPDMVDSVEAELTARGFTTHRHRRPGNIHVEKYW